MNATLVHTTSTTDANAVRIAQVAAAGRVKRQRLAAEYRAVIETARREGVVDTYLADAARDGAERMGFKICTDEGKIRYVLPLDEARGTLLHYYGQDMEAWGIRADGEYVAIW